MKKSLIFAAVLFLFAGAVLCWAHSDVNAVKNQITVKGTILFGDPKEAANFLVQNRVQCADHLFWDLAYLPTEPAAAKTKFTFFTTPKYEYENPETDLALALPSNGMVSWSAGMDPYAEGANSDLPLKPILAVAEKTAPGETREEVILLKDYYSFYPINLHGQINGQGLAWAGDDSSSLITEYFRIPTRPDDTMSIRVTKGANGKVMEAEFNTLKGGLSLWSSGAATEEGFYFTVEGQELDENAVEVRRATLSDNVYGIHFLPFKAKGNEQAADEFDVSHTKRVYPLDPSQKVVALEKGVDDAKLLLFTEEDSALFLSVIEIEAMTLLQKTKLSEEGAFDSMEVLFYEDFLITFLMDGRFNLISEAEGRYQKELSGNLFEYFDAENKIIYNYKSSLSFHYDGTRLAAALMAQGDTDFYNSVQIYDHTGLLFAGTYAYSLNSGHTRNVQPAGKNPIRISPAK